MNNSRYQHIPQTVLNHQQSGYSSSLQQQSSTVIKKEMIDALYSDIESVQLEATQNFRKLLSRDPNPPIEEVIQRHSENNVVTAALRAVGNIVTGPRRMHTSMCDFLTVVDSDIVQVALNALENILKAGEKFTARPNPYAMAIEECGGLDKIEYLQSHENRDIYHKSFYIIEQYFGNEEEDLRVAPSVEGNQYAFNTDLATKIKQLSATSDGIVNGTSSQSTSSRIDKREVTATATTCFLIPRGRSNPSYNNLMARFVKQQTSFETVERANAVADTDFSDIECDDEIDNDCEENNLEGVLMDMNEEIIPLITHQVNNNLCVKSQDNSPPQKRKFFKSGRTTSTRKEVYLTDNIKATVSGNGKISIVPEKKKVKKRFKIRSSAEFSSEQATVDAILRNLDDTAFGDIILPNDEEADNTTASDKNLFFDVIDHQLALMNDGDSSNHIDDI
ncbi:Importin subunit alpha-5 [Eumeta japonica]|uniref:Importin subunit alpha-5 n=1 Tax=Eumeta variegata TaxID=151549 RepID=A0A4C1TKI7_EUMVA|nr:Importin subunit alpha-5 [Eumeta japonica]